MGASLIRVGCGGFPVGRGAYFGRFQTVEIDSTFFNLPRLETAQRWKQEAPRQFEYSMRAWQLITHPPSSSTYRRLSRQVPVKVRERCGHFKPNDETTAAWEATCRVAQALKPKFLVFQTPTSFYPSADHLRNMYRFFKSLARGPIQFVWEPVGNSWKPPLISRVCADLGLVHGMDPLAVKAARSGVKYFRLRGRLEGSRIGRDSRYTDEELNAILERCQGSFAYVYFNNIAMWEDAQRFQDKATACGARK